jgi:Short C-terminal domain
MAIFQELSGQGRVVGGYLSSGTVLSGGTTPFSKNSDLSIQHPSNPFKRHKVNTGTVSEWEELDAKEGVAGAMGQAAARAALPRMVGKAVGAGLGAALNSGHTVRVSWTDGKQSIIQFPEKQFMVFSVLLKERQIATELSAKPQPEAPPAQPGVAEKIVDLASSVFANGRRKSPTVENVPVQDATEQIAKLASLHAQGILTDAEFSDKKAELLKRL